MMPVFNKAEAIISLNPDLRFKVVDDSVHWLIGTDEMDSAIYGEPDYVVPTDSEIQAEIQRLQAEYDSQAYARERKRRYDSVNQLEMMSDDSINGTTTHKDFILKVKADVPKTWTKENT